MGTVEVEVDRNIRRERSGNEGEEGGGTKKEECRETLAPIRLVEGKRKMQEDRRAESEVDLQILRHQDVGGGESPRHPRPKRMQEID